MADSNRQVPRGSGGSGAASFLSVGLSPRFYCHVGERCFAVSRALAPERAVPGDWGKARPALSGGIFSAVIAFLAAALWGDVIPSAWSMESRDKAGKE